MRRIFCLLLIFLILSSIKAQTKPLTAEILSPKDIKLILTDSLKKAFNLTFHVFRAYRYTDKSGEFLCILTESNDSIGNQKDTFNRAIKAITLKINKTRFEKVWELNDYIQKRDNEEQSFWFWTKYCDFEDFDNDSIVEPIIVYGTNGINDYDDGRIKFIIYYKGQKIAIRHQNAILDNDRKTQVDDAFYSLPKRLKDTVKRQMKIMEKEYKVIFTATW